MKKIFCWLACMGVCLNSGQAMVHDTQNYAWEASVNYLINQGIVQGYPDGTFRPNQPINRAEFIKIVMESAYDTPTLDGLDTGCFPDVKPENWFAGYVCLAQQESIIKGYPDGTFRPAQNVNQAEALKILYETFYKNLPHTEGPWYQVYLNKAQQEGLFYFSPENPAAHVLTRGEMAYFTAYFLDENKTLKDQINSEGFDLKTLAQTPLLQSQKSTEGMLLTLSIPSINNLYYADDWAAIVDFHAAYARAVRPPDTVKVLVDKITRPLVEDKFAAGVLETSAVEDIWMRDFSSVNPYDPIQFAYGGGLEPLDAAFIQQSFNNYARGAKSSFRSTDYILDGGNIVDNYNGHIITTDRFLEDNQLSYQQGKAVLAELYGATAVAILPADDEALGHSDGMVMWADTNTLLVNQYEGSFRDAVLTELEKSFPDVKIVEVETLFDEAIYDVEAGIGSACGINLNSVLTRQNIYVPTFGMTTHDQNFLATLKTNTTKTVIPIDARGVCHMGGSVRCLTWQQLN